MAFSRFFIAALVLIAANGCSAVSPTAPTPSRSETSTIQTLVARASADASGAAMERALAAVFTEGGWTTAAVTFPPRNEPLEFRNALEVKYRDGLRRGAVKPMWMRRARSSGRWSTCATG
jgi:hypothetical protein